MFNSKRALSSAGAAAAALLLVLAGASASAQEPSRSDESTQGTATVVRKVATVSIQNAALTPAPDADGRYSLGFDFVNGEMVQTGIRFGVRLVRESDGMQETISEMVYPDEISLGAGERKRIDVEYAAPADPRGTFGAWVVARMPGGAVVGLAPLGEVTVKGTGDFIEILASTCVLMIEGGTEEYGIAQGVDISADETLVAACEAQSGFDDAANVEARFKGFRRTRYGDPVAFTEPSAGSIEFKGGERKTFSVRLPKVTEPQAYDAELTLYRGGKAVSNSVSFHFVLQGKSATIQNIRLDKKQYEKGEVAAVSLFWSASADSFAGSRSGSQGGAGITATVQMMNASGGPCSDRSTVALEGNSGEATLPLPVKSSCPNPVARVTLASADGTVLDSRDAVADPEAPLEPVSDSERSPMFYVAVFIGALAVAFAAVLLFRKYSRKGPSGPSAAGVAVAIMIAGFSVLGMPASVNAAGATYENGWDIPGVIVDWITYYVSLDKDVYSPGEDVIVSATSGVDTVCANGAYNQVSASIYDTEVNWSKYLITKTIIGKAANLELLGSGSFKAPTTPGEYTVNFQVYYRHGGYSFSQVLPVKFRVDDRPPQPTNVTASCPVPGNAVTVNWSNPTGYSHAYVRVHDETADAPAYYSPVITGNSYTWNGAIPGRRYSYWVHTTNAAGSPYSFEVPAYRTASVTCPLPPSPTNMTGSCPAPGTSATMSWTAPVGYTNFAPRLCDKTVNPTCNPNAAGFWRNDDLAATSWTVNGLTPGNTYGAWVHTVGNPNPATAPDFSCPLAPACGSAAKTYPNSATSFGSDTYCAVGNLSTSVPAFPNEGEGSTWNCRTASGGTVSCSAYRDAPSVTQGFTLVADPTLIRGKKTGITGSYSQTNTAEIRVVPQNGFTGQVRLTAVMPVGAAEPVILPDRVSSPGYVARMFARIPGKAPIGTFEIIVTGTSGSRTATTSVWVDISDGTGGQM